MTDALPGLGEAKTLLSVEVLWCPLKEPFKRPGVQRDTSRPAAGARRRAPGGRRKADKGHKPHRPHRTPGWTLTFGQCLGHCRRGTAEGIRATGPPGPLAGRLGP